MQCITQRNKETTEFIAFIRNVNKSEILCDKISLMVYYKTTQSMVVYLSVVRIFQVN